jgi:hypothetical protein
MGCVNKKRWQVLLENGRPGQWVICRARGSKDRGCQAAGWGFMRLESADKVSRQVTIM